MLFPRVHLSNPPTLEAHFSALGDRRHEIRKSHEVSHLIHKEMYQKKHVLAQLVLIGPTTGELGLSGLKKDLMTKAKQK